MNFYNNLTENGAFFFWVVVFLVVVLIVLSIALLNKNKKLKRMIEKEENKEDILPINDNVKEEIEIKDEPFDFNIEKVEEIKEEAIEPKDEIFEIKEEDKEEKTKVEVSTPMAYQRNVLREMSRRMPTSPIHIERSEYDDDASIYTVTNSAKDYDIDGIDLKEDALSPLEELSDNYEVNDSMRYASEIVSRMEEELKPSNIELTEFEKKQEEEAIISYGELEKVKDKIYNLTEEEETDEFIDELKNFRLDLR